MTIRLKLIVIGSTISDLYVRTYPETETYAGIWLESEYDINPQSRFENWNSGITIVVSDLVGASFNTVVP